MSGVVAPRESREYFAQARTWLDDRLGRAERLVRLQSWMIALLGAVAICLSGALIMLMPLKETVPFVVRVDAATGIVDNIVRVTGSQMTQEEAVTRYFVRRYVMLRESYTRSQIEPAFREMVLLTTAPKRQALQQEYAFASPSSPYKRLGEQGTRSIQVKSVSRIAANVFQVRFLATEQIAGIERSSHRVASIEYEYQKTPERESSLTVNPLGFVVTGYRTDVEASVAGAS